jgi:hypothetical protein
MSRLRLADLPAAYRVGSLVPGGVGNAHVTVVRR